jgi:hypothetical protein
LKVLGLWMNVNIRDAFQIQSAPESAVGCDTISLVEEFRFSEIFLLHNKPHYNVKTGVACCSETSVRVCHTTWCHIPHASP